MAAISALIFQLGCLGNICNKVKGSRIYQHYIQVSKTLDVYQYVAFGMQFDKKKAQI